MHLPVHLLIPLACGLVYVVGVLMLKRVAELGVGVWRATFVANWVIALLAMPVWWWRTGPDHPWGDYWQPATTAALFVIGFVLTLLALNRGDVSVATPVLGLKVVLVALFSALLPAGAVPLRWWAGAALSTAGIALLNRRGPVTHHDVGRTIVLAALSAAAFALGDVLIQKWVPAWGICAYAPVMFGLVALYSFALVPLFSAPLSALSAQSWRWLAPGAVLIGLNNLGIAATLGIFGDATAVNIVYSSRGLWSVVLVWLVGHWFASAEHQLDRRVLRSRLAGAALMVAAIALVLV